MKRPIPNMAEAIRVIFFIRVIITNLNYSDHWYLIGGAMRRRFILILFSCFLLQACAMTNWALRNASGQKERVCPEPQSSPPLCQPREAKEGKPLYYGLIPFTFVADVVTSPIQWILLIKATTPKAKKTSAEKSEDPSSS